MTQAFLDDDQASSAVLAGLPAQRRAPAWGHEPVLTPAMMAGKGVRAVRCVGCQRETLPRTDDGAPLCAHCCEVLAGTGRTRGWWRRRP